MLTRADINVTKVTLTKNLVSDQTETNLVYALGSPVFDATYGHGISTNTSIVTLITAGGFNDQRVTGTMRWRGPTASPNEEIGIVARFQTNEAAGYTTYYYARCDGGTAKLTKVVGGAFTNISTGAYSLPADTDVTITLTCNGNAISATFNTAAGSPANVALSGTDTAITTGGLMGYRTLTTAGYCSNISGEQL